MEDSTEAREGDSRSGSSALLSGADAAELDELRASSIYAEPVIQRAIELDERLRLTAERIAENLSMPPVMQKAGWAAIRIDIESTVSREWLTR